MKFIRSIMILSVLMTSCFATSKTGAKVEKPIAVTESSDTRAAEAATEVLKVEAIRLEAMLDADVETLDQITGDDYVHVESTGQVRTKAQFLDGLKNRVYRFKSFIIEENNVNVMGTVAVVTGSYRNIIETSAGVQPVKYARHIRVYALRDGKWINVAHQATAILPRLR